MNLADVAASNFLEFTKASQTSIFVITLALKAITQSSKANPEWKFTIEHSSNHLTK
jgi:hypothetical protein